jgi:hypothetical protein
MVKCYTSFLVTRYTTLLSISAVDYRSNQLMAALRSVWHNHNALRVCVQASGGLPKQVQMLSDRAGDDDVISDQTWINIHFQCVKFPERMQNPTDARFLPYDICRQPLRPVSKVLDCSLQLSRNVCRP